MSGINTCGMPNGEGGKIVHLEEYRTSHKIKEEQENVRAETAAVLKTEEESNTEKDRLIAYMIALVEKRGHEELRDWEILMRGRYTTRQLRVLLYHYMHDEEIFASGMDISTVDKEVPHVSKKEEILSRMRVLLKDMPLSELENWVRLMEAVQAKFLYIVLRKYVYDLIKRPCYLRIEQVIEK